VVVETPKQKFEVDFEKEKMVKLGGFEEDAE
jgi:hypothetical protein